MTWCDDKIEKFGDFAPGVKSGVTDKEEKKEIINNTRQEKNIENNPPGVTETTDVIPETNYDASVMPVPKISHDWYQTETTIVVEIRIKKLSAETVKIEMEPTSLSVTAKLPSGSDYSLELDLAHPIVPDQSSYKILSTKLEVKLRKAEDCNKTRGNQWLTHKTNRRMVKSRE